MGNHRTRANSIFSSLFRRRAKYSIVLVLFLCVVTGAWGSGDKEWTGADSSEWGTAANWKPSLLLPPGTDSIVIIPTPSPSSVHSPVIDSTVTDIKQLSIEDSAQLEINAPNGSLTVTEGLRNLGKITINKTLIVDVALENANTGTITVNAGATLTVNGTLTNNGTITVNAGATLTVNGTLTNNDNGTITVNGTLNVTGSDIFTTTGTINGDTNGTINIKNSGNATLDGTIDTSGKISRTVGATTISIANIRAGEISFGGAVTLGENVTITTTGTGAAPNPTGNITFDTTSSIVGIGFSLELIATLPAADGMITPTAMITLAAESVGSSGPLKHIAIKQANVNVQSTNMSIKDTSDNETDFWLTDVGILTNDTTSFDGLNVTVDVTTNPSTNTNTILKFPIECKVFTVKKSNGCTLTINAGITTTDSFVVNASLGIPTIAIGENVTIKAPTISFPTSSTRIISGTTPATLTFNITDPIGTLSFPGDVSLGASITANKAITFNKPVVLLADVTVTTTEKDNGDITFSGTINGTKKLTLSAAGKITLGGMLPGGHTTTLSKLTIKSANNMDINGTVDASNVDFTNLTGILDVKDANYLNTALTFADSEFILKLPAAVPNLNCTSLFADFSVTLALDQNTTIKTTGNITFDTSTSTINSADEELTLTTTGITAESGTVKLGGRVVLLSLTVNAHNIAVPGSGKTITASNAINFTTINRISVNAEIKTTRAGAITFNASKIELNANISATNGNVILNNSVILFGNITISTTETTGNITFNDTIGTTGGKSLTLSAVGKITLGGMLPGSHTTTLSKLTIKSANNMDINGTVDASNVDFTNLTGILDVKDANYLNTALTFTDSEFILKLPNILNENSNLKCKSLDVDDTKLALDQDTFINSNEAIGIDIDANSTINGGFALTLIAIASNDFSKAFLNGAIGNTAPLKSLTVSGNPINVGANITTTDAIVFNNLVTLKQDVTISTTTTTGSITFDATATATIKGTKKLTLDAKGNVDFGNLVTELTALIFTGSGDITLSGGNNLSAIDVYFDHNGGTIKLDGALTCKNFYFYRGELNLNSQNITTSADFVVFGTDYNPDDKGWPATATHTQNTRYAYYHGAPLAYYPTGADYDSDAKTVLFGSELRPSAAFTANSLNGTTITVGGNFYNNGADMIGSAAWNLVIPTNVPPPTLPLINDTNVATEKQWGVPYAVAFNMTVAHSNAKGATSGKEDKGWVTAATGLTGQNVTNGGNNNQWQFGVEGGLKIDEIRIIADNKVEIVFNMAINTKQELLVTTLTHVLFDGVEDKRFGSVSARNDPISGVEVTILTYTTPTGVSWNTDTIADTIVPLSVNIQSTNSAGAHQTTTPVIGSFNKGVFYAEKGSIMSQAYDGSLTIIDQCKPALIGVYTGQEMHDSTNEGDALKKYDAHNFIEFQYSEPVNIDESNTVPESAVNVRATDTLGHIPDNTNGLNVTGLGTITSGSLTTGNREVPSNDYVNSLYRNFSLTPTIADAENQTHRVRVSIAGYVAGVEPVGGVDNHKWIGYIDYPTGAVPTPLNGIVTPAAGVKDKAITPNVLWISGSGSDPNPPVVEINKFPSAFPKPANGLYNDWDTSPPVFAKYSVDDSTWINPKNIEKEITGYSNTNWMQNVEFHFFDNTPDYTVDDTYKWVSGSGWLDDKTPITDSFNDTYGGSRFVGTNRTKGGIRANSLVGSIDTFNIQIDGERIAIDSTNFSQKVQNPTLFGSVGGTDSLYLSLKLTELNTYRVNKSFSLTYDGDTGLITDLAGNKMKTATVVESIHVPRIILTVAPVGMDEMYVLFSTQMDITDESLESIPKNLEIDPPLLSGLIVNEGVAALVATDSEYGTGFIITLKDKVTYEDITAPATASTATIANSFTIKYPPDGYGIKRKGGGVFAQAQAYPLSTFGVNVVNPLYAFDNKVLEDGNTGIQGEDLFGDGEWAVRLFDGSGSTLNKVIAGQDITLGLTSVATDNVRMILDTNPLLASSSTEFNLITGLNSRVWIPGGDKPPFSLFPIPSISSDLNNSSALQVLPHYVTAPTTVLPFPAMGLKGGDQVQFIFEIEGKTIDHDSDEGSNNSTAPIPFYVVRLKDPEDPASIDLWSLDISDITHQRGNVTILNNVINTNTSEKVRVEVNMPSAGNLTVQVLTLDGNVVKTLHRGRAEAGLRYYTWDGTNSSGDSVARGMYFVRVVGPGIDETRKVMAIKE